ncbi:MAG: hypothetical protein HYZ58_16205, partial [Acidobacteria bacterium]|nr:hypothetical protein [Acidobacteriota bacterium]
MHAFSRFTAAGCLAALLTLSPATRPPSPEHSSTPTPDTPGAQDATTQDDQTDLSVTVYNSDIALVRDVREVRLPSGTFDLRFMDIAATVN